MKLELIVDEKTFTNEKGKPIKYFALSTVIDGQTFLLKVFERQKALFNYVVRNGYDLCKK